MDPQALLIQSYHKKVKDFKSFTILGEFLIFILRLLVQRIFSLYIGIVLIQFIIATQMTFKTYCSLQSKLYIIMNFILIYLLVINFVQTQTNQAQTIQNALKDKYIINYIKFGYPLQFLFRIISTLLIWRVYQFSKMKTSEYGDVAPNDEVQTNTQRNDRIHIRQNTHQSNFHWGNDNNRNQLGNSGYLNPSENFSQSNSNNPPQIIRQISSRSNNRQQRSQNNNERAGFNINRNQPSVIANNSYQIQNRPLISGNRSQNGAERNQPQWIYGPQLGPNPSLINQQAPNIQRYVQYQS